MAKAGVIVPLVIVGVLAAGTAGLYFGLKDNTPCPFKAEEISNDGVLKRQLVRSLAKAKDEKKIEYSLDQNCLNQILSNASSEIKKGIGDYSSYIGSIYVEIEGKDNYKFYIEATTRILNSRVLLDTTLTSDDDSYYFNLNDVKAGNIPVGWILNRTNVLSSLPLEGAFKDMGLSMKVDHDRHRIVYKKDDMEKDLLAMMTSDADDLLQGALETIPLTFNFDKGINAHGDLSGLVDNSSVADCSLEGDHYSNYAAALSIIDNGINATKTLLRDGGNEEESLAWGKEYFEKHLQNLMLKGQEANDLMKTRMADVDPSEYAAEHYDKKVSYFTEKELNSVLASTGIVGKSYIFNYADEVAYVVVDRFYSDIFVDQIGDAYLNFTIGVNINGLETRATIQTKCAPRQNSFQTEFKIQNIYFGNNVAPEKFAEVCKNMFSDALDTMEDRSWIEHEKGSDSMTLNFDRLLSEDVELSDYNDIFNTIGGIRSFKVDGASLTSNGEFSLWYQK